MNLRTLIALSLCLVSLNSFANKRDSLLYWLQSHPTLDTNHINIQYKLARNYYFLEDRDVDHAILTLTQAKEIANDLNTHHKLGIIYSLLAYLKQNYTTDINAAIEDYYEAIRYFEQDQNLSELSYLYVNLGGAYHILNQTQNSISAFEQVLELGPKVSEPLNFAIAHYNLGAVLLTKQEEKNHHLQLAKQIYTDLQDELGLSQVEEAMLNVKIDNSSLTNEDRLQAIDEFKFHLQIFKKYEDWGHYSSCIANLGTQQIKAGFYKEGFKNLQIADSLASSTNDILALIEIYPHLARQANKLERPKMEAHYLNKLLTLKDSLHQINQTAAIEEMKTKYETEKKDAQLIAEKAENDKIRLETEKERQQKYILYGGLSLALLFALFIFNRFRVTRKQKAIIEHAHAELGEKNKEILDSINYAKRIQTAILPPQRIVKEYLQDSFILYKPKDIVAGDFYWLEQKDDKVLFAAADCTGHGVPGAMVSVVCNNGLNRSVREYGLTDPGKILDKTREIVIQEFEKSEEEVKDGMDIALCCLDGSSLTYAGANNALWIIRKDSSEVEEIKANKQPIGKFGQQNPFTTHRVDLNKGDTFYIFSDGFADQFGGEKGKKFKTANFKRLLLSMQNESISKQKELIDDTFKDWMGNLEQLDDVCVIGVRV